MADRIVLYKGPGAISFHGRAQRREWMVGFGVNSLIGGVIGALSSIGPVLSLPWAIAVLAVTSRRLHDLGRSGWLQVAPMAITAAAMLLYWAVDSVPLASVTMGIALIVYFAFYVCLAAMRGDQGPNAYGEVD